MTRNYKRLHPKLIALIQIQILRKEVKELNKKFLLTAITVLALIMLVTPLASGQVWDKNMNNDKFKSYSSTHMPNPMPIILAEKEFKPSEEDPNVIVVSWEEAMVSYQITVGEETYSLHTHFEYEGNSKWVAIGAPFTTKLGLLPWGSKSNYWIVEYTLDFSAVPDGIEGTLDMLMIDNNGQTSIRSLRGTGDLQNVHIMATAVLGEHTGIVTGWPE